MKNTLVLLILGMTGLAWADQETTIVITPTGNKTPIEQSPGSITVVSAEEIEKRGYTTLAEALESVPGIVVVRSGSAGQITSLFSRGANSNHTLVMRDGMVLNDPSSPTGAYDFSNLSLQAVERIEIVRGPLSTLYGSSAMGAVINIITRRGTLRPRHSMQFALNDDGWAETALSSSGSSGKLRYQLTLSNQHSQGQTAVMQKPAYHNTGQKQEKDGTANTGLDTSLTWHISDESSLELLGFMRYARSEIDEFLIEDPDWILRNREKGVQLRYTNRPVNGDLQFQLAIRHNQTDRRSQNPRQNPTQNLIDTRYRSKHQSIETRFDYYAVPNHEISWILAARRDGLSTSGASAFGSPFGDFVINEMTNASVQSHSLTLQDQWTGKQGESLTGSIRIENHENYGEHVSWRLAGSLPFDNKRGRLHIAAGTGFKAPSLYELFGNSPNNFGSAYRGNPNLQPETSRSIEAGIDYRFPDSGITSGMTIYKTEIRDLIQTVYDPLFNSTSVNVARASVHGGELYLNWELAEDIDLRLDYSYTDARNKTSGTRLVRRPRHKADISLDYTFSDRLSLWAALHYVADRIDINPVFNPAQPTIQPDDYLILDVGANYRINDTVRLFGKIRNLNDASYEPVAGYRGEGINGIVGVTINL